MKRVIYIQYANPAGYPPLEHGSRILADQGWQILFVGIGVASMAGFILPGHANITVRQLPPCAPGWRQKLHYAWFTLYAIIQTLVWRSEWAYVSDPLACPAGWLLSFWPGLRVLYHEHDWPAAESSAFMRFVLWTRRALARRAKLCVIPNQRRAEQFARTMQPKSPVVCVWNCPSKNEVGASRASRNGSDLWILYHGSIVPARLPTTVIEALARVPASVKMRVVGYETIGHKGYIGQLQALAEKFGVAHRMEFIGAVPTRAELLARCRECDVGVTFMPKSSRDINEQAMTGASNKAFDYLACGLVLLVADLPEWHAMYVEGSYGLACDPDDPASVATALRWLLDHPDQVRAMGERGRQQVLAEWNYEKKFDPVLEVLRKET